MRTEIASLAEPMKSKLQPRIKSYADEIKKAKKDLVIEKSKEDEIINWQLFFYSQTKSISERDQLLGTGSHAVDIEANGFDQRSRVMNGTERLQDSSRKLEQAQRIALETGS